MIQELNHVGLLTADMESSRRFYEEVLGGIVIRDFVNDQGQSQFVYVQLGLGVIELIRVAPDSTNTGLAHVAFLIDKEKNLDEVYSSLCEMGYNFTVLPKTASSGDGKLAFFLEDSHCLFELIQREENIRIRDHKSDLIEAFEWIGVCSSYEQAEKSGKFYQETMDFEKVPMLPEWQEKAQLYRHGSDYLAVFEQETAPEKALDHICLSVYHLDDIYQKLTAENIVCSEIKSEKQLRYFEAVGPQKEKVIFMQKSV